MQSTRLWAPSDNGEFVRRRCRDCISDKLVFRPSISSLRKQYCPEVVDLVERMWAHDSAERPTMTEVVKELEHLVSVYR